MERRADRSKRLPIHRSVQPCGGWASLPMCLISAINDLSQIHLSAINRLNLEYPIQLPGQPLAHIRSRIREPKN